MKTITNSLIIAFLSVFAYQTNAQVHIITQQSLTFSPNDIQVNVGDTIRWVWTAGTHTTTSTVIPLNAVTWDSPLTQSNTFFEYVVTEPGLHEYKCTPHASMGMIGSFTANVVTNLSVQENIFVNIYPNPTSDYINISFDGYNASIDLEVFDIIGNKTIIIKDISEAIYKIDVKNWHEGIYFIKIYDGLKLVKQQKIVIVK